MFGWPLVTIDFEASGLSAGAYPIEVGVCVWRGPGEPLFGWSSLIKPLAAWSDHGDWCETAEAVPCIPRTQLDGGIEPSQVLLTLNTILDDGGIGWCDGVPFDVGWARKLSRAADARPTFRIGHLDMLTAKLDLDAYKRMASWLDAIEPAHRARADAERLMQRLARGLGIEHGPILDIDL